MRALLEESAAVLIDIQEKLLPAMDGAQQITENTIKFIQGLQILKIPIITVRQYPKGLGDIIAPIRQTLAEYTPFDKITFSAGDDERITEHLKTLGKKNLFLFGIEAHVCVLQSAIDFVQAGYQVFMPVDCTTSRRAYDKKTALRRAETEGVYLTTYEAALFELLRKAGNDTFKQISALVK